MADTEVKEQALDLRTRGLDAARAGDNDQARALLRQSLQLNTGDDATWVALAGVVADPAQRRECYGRALGINPNNQEAMQGMQGALAADLAAPADAAPEPAAPQPTQLPQQPQRKSKGHKILAIGTLAAIILALVIGAIRGPQKPTSSTPSDSSDGLDAFLMCKQFVEKRLKAPATADFASYSDSKVTALSRNSKGQPQYLVVSYVDSQNSFGAQLRKTYTCNVAYEGSDQWRLNGLSTDP